MMNQQEKMQAIAIMHQQIEQLRKKNIRLLRKLAEASEIKHQAGEENRSVHEVHEDSSTALMLNFASTPSEQIDDHTHALLSTIKLNYTANNITQTLNLCLQLILQCKSLPNEIYDILANCFNLQGFHEYALYINHYLFDINYEPRVSKLNNLLQNCLLQKKPSQAINFYTNFFIKNPQLSPNNVTQLLLARSYLNNENYSQAHNKIIAITKQYQLDINQLSSIHKDFYQYALKIFLIQAHIFERQQQLAKAKSHYDILRRENPNHFKIQNMAANFYQRHIDIHVAEEIYKNYSVRHPNDLNGMLAYALFLSQTKSTYREARELCENFTQQYHNHSQVKQPARFRILQAWFAENPQTGLEILAQIRTNYPFDHTLYKAAISYAARHKQLSINEELKFELKNNFFYQNDADLKAIEHIPQLVMLRTALIHCDPSIFEQDIHTCIIDAQGNIYDPPNRQSSNPQQKQLIPLSDPGVIINSNPISILNIIHYLTQGYTCSADLQHALNTWSIHNNRLLRKLAEASEIKHQAGAENRSVHEVHEDSSTALMLNFAASVEFPKKSNTLLDNLDFTNELLKYLCNTNKINYVQCLQNQRMIQRIFNLPLDNNHDHVQVCKILLDTLFAKLPTEEQTKWVNNILLQRKNEYEQRLQSEYIQTQQLQQQIHTTNDFINNEIQIEMNYLQKIRTETHTSILNNYHETIKGRRKLDKKIRQLENKLTTLRQKTQVQQIQLNELSEIISQLNGCSSSGVNHPTENTNDLNKTDENAFTETELTQMLNRITLPRLRFWLHKQLMHHEDQKGQNTSSFILINYLKMLLKDQSLTTNERTQYKNRILELRNTLEDSMFTAIECFTQGKNAFKNKLYDQALYYFDLACEYFARENHQKIYFDAYIGGTSVYSAKNDWINVSERYSNIKKWNNNIATKYILIYQQAMRNKLNKHFTELQITNKTDTPIPSLWVAAMASQELLTDIIIQDGLITSTNTFNMMRQVNYHELSMLKSNTTDYVISMLELANLFHQENKIIQARQCYETLHQHHNTNPLPLTLLAFLELEYSAFLVQNPLEKNTEKQKPAQIRDISLNISNNINPINIARINHSAATKEDINQISLSQYNNIIDWLHSITETELPILALHTQIMPLREMLLDELNNREQIASQDEFLQLQRYNNAEQWLQQALLAHEQGNHHAAIVAYKKVIERNPNHLQAYMGLINLYITQEDWMMVLQYYTPLSQALVNLKQRELIPEKTSPIHEAIKLKFAEYRNIITNSSPNPTLINIYWKCSSCINLLNNLPKQNPSRTTHKKTKIKLKKQSNERDNLLIQCYKNIILSVPYESAAYGIAHLELVHIFTKSENLTKHEDSSTASTKLDASSVEFTKKDFALFSFIEACTSIPDLSQYVSIYNSNIAPILHDFNSSESIPDDLEQLIILAANFEKQTFYSSALTYYLIAISKTLQQPEYLPQADWLYLCCCCALNRSNLIFEDVIMRLITYYEIIDNSETPSTQFNKILSILNFSIEHSDRILFPHADINRLPTIISTFTNNNITKLSGENTLQENAESKIFKNTDSIDSHIIETQPIIDNYMTLGLFSTPNQPEKPSKNHLSEQTEQISSTIKS